MRLKKQGYKIIIKLLSTDFVVIRSDQLYKSICKIFYLDASWFHCKSNLKGKVSFRSEIKNNKIGSALLNDGKGFHKKQGVTFCNFKSYRILQT